MRSTAKAVVLVVSVLAVFVHPAFAFGLTPPLPFEDNGSAIDGASAQADQSQFLRQSLWGRATLFDCVSGGQGGRISQVLSGGDQHLRSDGSPQTEPDFRRLTAFEADHTGTTGSDPHRCELGRNRRLNTDDGTGADQFGRWDGRTMFYKDGDHTATYESIRLPADFHVNDPNWQVVMQIKQTQPYAGEWIYRSTDEGGCTPYPLTSPRAGALLRTCGPALSVEARYTDPPDSRPAGSYWVVQNFHKEIWWAPASTSIWTRFRLDVNWSPTPAQGSLDIDVDLNNDGDFTDSQENQGTITNIPTMAVVKDDDPSGLSAGQAIPASLRTGPYISNNINCGVPGNSGCSVDVDSIEVVDLQAPTPKVTIPQPNLEANQSFETPDCSQGSTTGSTTGWDSFNGTIATVNSPLDAPHCNWYARVSPAAGATSYTIDDATNPVSSSRAGRTYTGTAWVKGDASSAGKVLNATIREGAGASVGYTTASVVLSADTWKQIQVSRTATTSANPIDLYFWRGSSGGVSAGESFLIDAVSLQAPNAAPTANFSYSCSGFTCSFADSSSDSDGTIQTRAWSFGDGTSSSSTNPTHGFPGPGTYATRLTVTDDDGGSNSLTKNVVLAKVTIPQPNLEANQSFETPDCSQGPTSGSIAGWSSYNGTLATVNSPADAPHCNWYARVSPAAGATSYTIDDASNPVSSSIAGRTYTATAWVKGSASSDGKTLNAIIREGASGSVGYTTASVVLSASTWKKIQVSRTATKSGKPMDLYFARPSNGGVSAGESFLIDAISLVRP